MAARFSVLAVVAASVLADVALSWKSVSVEDYGAVGDNRTDNTKAFREALLAVRDGGGEVVVPFGKTCENPTACFPQLACQLNARTQHDIHVLPRNLTSATPAHVLLALCSLPNAATVERSSSWGQRD
jgi:hypothetical protein